MPEAARQQGPALFPSGVVCDRFRIDGVLGVGGTGTVFRALDLEREEIVALKAIPHDATLRQRARREASVAGKLRHPNVVRLRSVHEDGQYVYIASDIVEGMDLAGALRQGQLGDAALLRVASAVCAGLAHAHEHGVVHRDVKPANVLLGRDGSVRVLDFGIASLDEPDATVDDRMLGTLSYMAPETCQGARPTPATDVWAVGVMVYEALTGANPFRARTPDELRERHRHPPRSLGDLRPDLPRALAAGVRARARIASAPPPERDRVRPRALGAADAVERPARPRAARGGRGGGSRRSRRRSPRADACARARVARPCRAAGAAALLPGARDSISTSTGWAASALALRPRRAVASPSQRAARLAAGSACCAASRSWPCSGRSPSGRRPRAAAGLCGRRARARLALARGRVRARGLRARARRRLGGTRVVRRARGGSVAARLPARGAPRAAAGGSRRCSRRCSCGRSTCSPRAACAARSAARWPAPRGRSRSRSGPPCRWRRPCRAAPTPASSGAACSRGVGAPLLAAERGLGGSPRPCCRTRWALPGADC